MIGSQMRTSMFNSTMFKPMKNFQDKIPRPELPSLMMISQVKFTSKRLKQFRLLPLNQNALLLLKEEMVVMVSSLLIMLL